MLFDAQDSLVGGSSYPLQEVVERRHISRVSRRSSRQVEIASANTVRHVDTTRDLSGLDAMGKNGRCSTVQHAASKRPRATGTGNGTIEMLRGSTKQPRSA